MSTPDYRLSQLETLEAESIHVIREVAAELERPVLLFSGGKDSIVMLELARKAFAPARIPFPVMHVDTGLNFPDVLEFRDKRVAELGVQLIVASVPDAIAASNWFDSIASSSVVVCSWLREARGPVCSTTRPLSIDSCTEATIKRSPSSPTRRSR